MKTVWIAFFIGLFIGANIGVVIFALLRAAATDYNRYMPDIEDIEAEK